MGRLVKTSLSGNEITIDVVNNQFINATVDEDLVFDVVGTGKVSIPDTTAASSTSTGCLVLGGGLGMGGNHYVGGSSVITGSTTINSTTNSTNTSSGAVIVSGGIGVGGNGHFGGAMACAGLSSSGTISISDSTASSGYTSGALTVTGGIGCNNNLYVNGVGRFSNDVVAHYSSDERLKENISPIEDALNKIDAINGVTFDWNETALEMYPERTGRDVGVIAQQIQSIMPELVVERDNGYLAVNYEKITALLIQGIKELKAEIDELKKG
jgi:hypothetical protein